METKIREICEELCHKKLDMEESLFLSGYLDSFKLMELICLLEEEFHIRFTADEIMEQNNFSSVFQVIKLVKDKTGQDETGV